MMEKTRGSWKPWGVALALFAVLGIGVAAQVASVSVASDDQHVITEKEAREGLAHAQNLATAFRVAAQTAQPSVVTIRTKINTDVVEKADGRPNPQGRNPFEGTPHEDLFKRFGKSLPEGFDFGPMPPRMHGGMGSGVIIDSKGLILTNNHVVARANEVVVELLDGREFTATDVRTDPDTDLALISIKSEEALPAVKLGDSDRMAIGDWVIAIGNPFDLESTVSAGIISGKGRVLGSVRRAKFLQTDAAINPGNSGGPLINLKGEVIGINTAIASNNGGYQGIGFAVPANLASWVVEQLEANGRVERAYLGVGIGEVTAEVAEELDVELRSGVLVAQVYPDTPAATAGLRENDVIVRFADTPVKTPNDLQKIVERTSVEKAVALEVVREGDPVELKIELQRLPSDFGKRGLVPPPAEE